MSEKNCGPDQYLHRGHCCERCPKGQYVHADCDSSENVQCKTCRHGTYTDQNNYLHSCLACKSCDFENNQKILKTCEAQSDMRCGCVDGYYSEPSHTLHCEKVTYCPPGHGVSVPPTGTSDTICTECLNGTFNTKNDFTTLCHNHTRCKELNRYLVTPGTAKTDAVCGNFITSSPTCHWMIPTTSMWVCLTLTIILAAGICYCRSKYRKRKAVVTSVSEDIFNLPVLPPDIIKYPRSPETHKITHNGFIDELFTEGQTGLLECDGVESQMTFQNFSHFLSPDTIFTGPSTIKSEPEEDEWPGVGSIQLQL